MRESFTWVSWVRSSPRLDEDLPGDVVVGDDRGQEAVGPG